MGPRACSDMWRRQKSLVPASNHLRRGESPYRLTCRHVVSLLQSRPFKIKSGKGKVRPRTGHEGSDGEKRYSSTLSLTSVLDRGWMVNATLRPLYAREWDLVPIMWEAGWISGPVWTGVENLAPTGIRSPDCQARSKSLYRLCYPDSEIKSSTISCFFSGCEQVY